MEKFNKTHSINLKKNFALSMAYQILNFSLPFITAPYVSRVIGADGIGIYSFTNSILSYFTMFAVLGTNFYATREMSRNRDNRTTMSKIFWEIMIVRLITTAICITAWCIFIVIVPSYKIFYLILSIPLIASLFDISWLYMGLEHPSYTVYRNSLFRILSIVMTFILVKEKDDLIWFYFTTVGITLPSNLTLWIPLHKFVDKPNLKKINIKGHIKETIIFFVPTIAASIYTVLDKTLIGIITHSTAENGYYEQATKIIEVSKAITFAALNEIIGARISYLFEIKDYKEIKNKINQSINYVFFIGVGCCLGICGVADIFVPLFFGPGYENTIPILKLLSPIVIIISISCSLGSLYYIPSGRQTSSVKFLLIGTTINFILNLIFIPKLKSIGAVIGSLAAEMLIAILYISFSNGFLQIKTLLFLLWKKIIAGIIMYISILLIKHFFADNLSHIYLLIIQIIIGSSIYVLSLWIIRDSFIQEILFDKIIKAFYNKIRKKTL